MCGIAGILSLDGTLRSMAPLAPMAAAMARRGPDDEGFAVAGADGRPQAYAGAATPPAVRAALGPEVGAFPTAAAPAGVLGLAHRRLSILDLSPGGHQPMASADGRHWIVYNGELYNYRELRAELRGAGTEFRSECDTEVVLAAFRHWGPAALARFNGMFAMAIWDAEERRLFCARDRLGIKPFYVHDDGARLVFASDLKTMLASGLVAAAPDWEALYHGLSFYCAPRPLTAFAGVRALRQGHWATWCADGRRDEQRYWQVPLGEVQDDAPAVEWVARLRESLARAVERRLVADVPVGTFMSGGIDSTTVAALAAQAHPGIRAFTLGFPADDAAGAEFDEVELARATAARYGMDHIVERVRPEALLDHLDEITLAFEEPFISLPPMFLISQLVARHDVTVVLSGLGGDELFCGYGRERWLRLWRRTRALRPLAGAAGLAGRRLRRRDPRLGAADQFLRAPDVAAAYTFDFSFLSERTKHSLFGPQADGWDSPRRLADLYGLDELEFADDVQAICYLDVMNYVGNHFVHRTDQFTMHHSIEGRLPFLDHEVVELAFRMPSRYKIRHGERKWVLRQVARELIDPQSFDQPKRGFSLPMDAWMRGPLRALVRQKTEALAERGVLQGQAIRRLRRDFDAGRARYAELWSLVSLELWLEAFVDGAHATMTRG